MASSSIPAGSDNPDQLHSDSNRAGGPATGRGCTHTNTQRHKDTTQRHKDTKRLHNAHNNRQRHKNTKTQHTQRLHTPTTDKRLNPSKVVKADRPDLEEQKAALTRQQNEYKILLKARPSFYSWTDRITKDILQQVFCRVLRTICCSDSVLLAMTFSGLMFTLKHLGLLIVYLSSAAIPRWWRTWSTPRKLLQRSKRR